MIVNEETLLKRCKENGLEAFHVKEGLDWEIDVILNTDDIEEIFRLCKLYNEKVIFYSYTSDMNDDDLDIDSIERKVRDLVTKRTVSYTSSWFDRIESDDIDELIKNHIEDMKHILSKVEKKINLNALDIFISHFGDRIGISICAENENKEDNYENDDFENCVNKLVDIIVIEVEDLYNYRKSEREKKCKESDEKKEKERRELAKRRNEAIRDIKAEISSSSEILEYTNANLRHNYAKKLLEKYSEKYNIGIMTGEVYAIVELEYKKRKNYSRI